ncbi:glucokinase [bacterium BMS3Abin03]|nr:glucokinase [bacterium BMS3Abin03]HDZ58736.1 ROK family protein [Ignavibacteriales bacterium]
MKDKKKYAVGVDLGGTNIKIGLVSPGGNISKRLSINTEAEEGPLKVIENIKNGIHAILSKAEIEVEGIGIGCPGTVNPAKGIIENPPNLTGWNKINLGRAVSMEFEKDVYLENDANAAAIGEMIFGNGIKLNSFIMVTLGTGVGGGIVIKRRIYRGEFGAAGEIGHISINYKGPKCNCGSYGCIEAYAGSNYMKERIRNELKKNRNSLLLKLINNDYNLISPKKIKDAADKGDKFSRLFIIDLGEKLGAAFASLTNVLNIGTYIVGGGVAGFGRPLFDSIRKSLKSRVMAQNKNHIKIVAAKLKNDAGIKGASALVFHGF